MAIQVPTIYSTLLQKAVEATNNAQLLFSKEYEGEIKAIGDKVKIPNVESPRIQNYTAGQSLTIDNAELGHAELAINQAKGFTARLENFDSEASQVDIPTAIIEKAGKAFAADMDRYLVGLSSQVSNANKIGSVASPTEIDKNNALDVLCEVISLVQDRGVTGTVNVLIPALIAQHVPVTFINATLQAELAEMGIKQGFTINGANVYSSPITRQYLENTAISGDVISSDITAFATTFEVDSGANISDGDVIQVGSELMYVEDITSKTLTVIRGFGMTDKAPHAEDSAVKVMKESNIVFAADPTTFGAVAQKTQRLKVIDQISGQDAAIVQGFNYYGAKVLNGLAGGVAYIKKKTS